MTEKLSTDLVREAISKLTTQPTDDELDMKILEAREKKVRIQGLSQRFELRNKWSRWIIIWISALILFHSVLAVLVGCDVLDYAGMQWFITAVTVETFLQVIGLGYVAAKFLFSDPQK